MRKQTKANARVISISIRLTVDEYNAIKPLLIATAARPASTITGWIRWLITRELVAERLSRLPDDRLASTASTTSVWKDSE